MRWSVACLIALSLWIGACATETARTGALDPGERRAILQAIRLYYEQNAAEENNACSALIMSGVTRTEVVSDSGGELVLDVGYLYNNDAHRGSMRCRGTGNRQFTLSRGPNGFQVTDMTGDRRLGARWRLW